MDHCFDPFKAAPHRSSVENAPYGVRVRRLDDVEPDDFFSSALKTRTSASPRCPALPVTRILTCPSSHASIPARP
jgi:hypothetical protein